MEDNITVVVPVLKLGVTTSILLQFIHCPLQDKMKMSTYQLLSCFSCHRCGFATESAPRHIIPSVLTHTVNGKVSKHISFKTFLIITILVWSLQIIVFCRGGVGDLCTWSRISFYDCALPDILLILKITSCSLQEEISTKN